MFLRQISITLQGVIQHVKYSAGGPGPWIHSKGLLESRIDATTVQRGERWLCRDRLQRGKQPLSRLENNSLGIVFSKSVHFHQELVRSQAVIYSGITV